MIIKDNLTGDVPGLRKHAEKIAREKEAQSPEDIESLFPDEIRQILHELRVHQIELEMQNEELRLAQSELDVARVRYFDLYDLAPVGYFTVSEKGLILEANLTAATQLGSTRNALVKLPITRFILKEDQDIYYMYRKRLIKTGMPQECELRMLDNDGTMHWAHLAASVVQDADGALLGRIVMSDISERKRAEDELRESEDRFRKLFKGHSAPKLVIDSETGAIIDANEASAQFYGWPVEELKQMRIQQISLLSPEDVKAGLKKIVSQGAARLEFRHRRADGSIRDVEVFCNKIEIAGKTPLYAIIHDITERKKLEVALLKAHDKLEQQVAERTAELAETNEELSQEIKERKQAEKMARKSAERYAVAIAGSSDGIWDWDILSNIVFYSDRFKEILGYASEEFSDTVDVFRSLLHPEDADNVWEAVESHLKERVPYNIEYRMKTKAGEYRWLLARGQAIWDDNGNATRMAGSLQDITERMEAVQNLQNALLEIKDLKNRLETEKAYLQEEIKLENNQENIIGQSDGLKYVLYKAEQIAVSDTTVLVLGETAICSEIGRAHV